MNKLLGVFSICAVFSYTLLPATYGAAQLPNGANPSSDGPLYGSENALPASAAELPDLETLSPPSDLPMSKENLDSGPNILKSNTLAPATPVLPIGPASGGTSSSLGSGSSLSSGDAFQAPINTLDTNALPGNASPFQGAAPVFEAPGSPFASPTDSPAPTTNLPSPVSTYTGEVDGLSLGDASGGLAVQETPYPYMDESISGGEILASDGVGMYDGGVYEETSMIGPTLPVDCGSVGGAWDFGGWLSAGQTYNASGNQTSDGNAPLGFNNFADGLVLNQAWMYLAKETQTCGSGFDWGFRMDFMFGADAPDIQAFGDGSWDDSWDTGGEYGFAMPQLYGEIAYNRTKTKFGRFLTNLGYEVVQAPYNFFYSHSLSRYYNQPTTHTGFLTQFDLKPDLILFGGWTSGWDSGFDNRNDGSTFLGGMIWNVSDRFDLMYAATAGDPGDVIGAESDVYMHSVIADFKFGYGWNYVAQWDYQNLESGGGPATESNAFNQYLFKQLRPDLTVGGRFEYFRDENGARIGNGNGEYYGATFGVNWRPLSQMVVRPELRWDWFDGAGSPYDNNTSRDQFTIGMDAVYVF